jgi:putative hydrolase of the HAD superfamily
MEDVTVSSVTGYRKPHPEIFRISLRQMQTAAENCIYVGDTVVSRTSSAPRRRASARPSRSAPSSPPRRTLAVGAGAEKPDVVIDRIGAWWTGWTA